MTLALHTTPGHQLTPALRQEIIALCNRAYEEDLAELFATLTNATHVPGYYENELASHALWVARQLQVGSGPLLRTAYVELVATEPKYQQRGFAAVVMKRIVEEVQDYALAALSPFSVEFYGRLGWELWRGPLFIRTDTQLLASPSDEEVMIYRLPQTPPLDLSAPLSAEWREGELW